MQESRVNHISGLDIAISTNLENIESENFNIMHNWFGTVQHK